MFLTVGPLTGGHLLIFALCGVVASYVLPASAEFHGLFTHGSFEDFVAGHEYAPQPSTFEAAYAKLRKQKKPAAEIVEDVVEEVYRSLPEIDDSLLPDGHPHKKPAGFVKLPSSNAMFGTRRLGAIDAAVKPAPAQSQAQESETRRLLQLHEVQEEIGRRVLKSGGDGRGPAAVVTNGANAPGATKAPSMAAIGSDFFRFGSVTLPTFVNWTQTKVATYVHFEGSFCQSCWAIATADAISMMWLINKGMATKAVGKEMYPWDKNYGNPEGNHGADMSPQQICDCLGVSCCGGGWPESALEYAQLNGGLSKWADYPYTASINASQCDLGQSSQVEAQISGFEAVPAGNIQAFMQAVSMVPVITFISSSAPDFGNYTGGIYNGGCDEVVDHVVIITGYGVDPVAGPYWIIKNSWGPYWGERGYMRIVMNPGNGKCGITGSDGLYPVYYPTNGNPCQGTPNPCGSGTCFVQNLPGGSTFARCGCPTGYVENAGIWPTPSKCVPANPCDANPNPCGAGTCSAFKDGSYSCVCPQSMVVGASASGSPQCVASGGQTYTVQATDNCTSITSSYSLVRGHLEHQNPWLNCSATSLTAGVVLVIGNTSVPAGSTTYVSQDRETCAAIAYGYGITVAVLQQYNPTLVCSSLVAGTNLVMPPASGMVLPTTIPPTCVNIYSVKSGDTCDTIAEGLKMSVSGLMGLNPDISCSKPLSPPTTLCAGAASNGANSTIPGCSTFYSVKQGDTCPAIWNYANLAKTQFVTANPGIRCDRPHLRVGEKVCISAPTIKLAIPQGVPYVVQSGDTLASISYQWTMRCGTYASNASIVGANPVLFGAGGSAAAGTLSPGVQLVIPCPNAGSSDACGCGAWGPMVCGADYSWYYNSCDSLCNGGGYGYPSCTVCAQACFGRVTLPPPPGTPWGCVAGNGGLCLPTWTGSCQSWLAGCQNECSQAQWYGTWQNNNYWNCLSRCRGGC